MPKLLEDVELNLDREDLERRILLPRVRSIQRSSGVHLSGILKPLAIAAKYLKPGEALEDEIPILWALGIAWEEFAVSLYPDIEWQPGELAVPTDPITGEVVFMNADGVSYSEEYDCRIIQEFKFTFKSDKGGKEWMNDWMKMQQGLGYLKGYLPAEDRRIVQWHVCHIRGDYKAFGPTYRRYTVEFTTKEVEQTWKMISGSWSLAVPEAHPKKPAAAPMRVPAAARPSKSAPKSSSKMKRGLKAS